MGSANLALVFGPTLTRAPPDMDPRQLHNDVPSINVLVQLCIDYHDYIFGDEDEEEDAVREGSISPPQHTQSPLLEKLEDAVLQEPETTPPPPVHAPPPPVHAPPPPVNAQPPSEHAPQVSCSKVSLHVPTHSLPFCNE